MADVAQLRLARDYSVDTRDGAQIRVDGQEVVVRHALIVWPGHDLEKIAIDPREGRNAVCGSGGGTVRMQVIKILAIPDDLKKFRKRVAAFRMPGFIGCQVASDNVWTRRRPYWTEVLPPTQVGCRIDYLALVKVGVPTREVFEVWRCAAVVASITVVRTVDDIAP